MISSRSQALAAAAVLLLLAVALYTTHSMARAVSTLTTTIGALDARCAALEASAARIDRRSHDVSQSAHDALVQHVRQLASRVADNRRYIGDLACDAKGVGPTGGFCVQQEAAREGNNLLDEPVAAHLLELYAGGSVLDLGAGLGHYGRYFDAHASDSAHRLRSYAAYDGAEGIERATDGLVRYLDLTEVQGASLPVVDWVQSLEVAEHVPRQYEATFVRNIAEHARVGIVTSWATPEQPGFHHVNPKTHEDAVAVWRDAGFDVDEQLTRSLVDGSTLSWIGNNLLALRRRVPLDERSEL